MGGDHGPSVIVPAALEVLAKYHKLKLILVGNQDLLEEQLISINRKGHHPRLSIVHASEAVGMDEAPAEALRRKRDSSMRVAVDLVKTGTAQAVVSAGNTGALMAIARFVLKTLPGIDRPAIVYSLPTITGHTYMLDLGANVDCEPRHLLEFAVMGSVLAKAVDNNPHPKVGLLNVGSETIKGSEQVKQAALLLSALPADQMNYIGYVEGDGIYQGVADVVVCDGFAGNVALKASEGIVKMILLRAKEAFRQSLYARFAAMVALPVLHTLHKRLDPRCYNGASLLGLHGIVIKSHGKADEKAFAQAIYVAMREIEKNVPEKIRAQVSAQLGEHTRNAVF